MGCRYIRLEPIFCKCFTSDCIVMVGEDVYGGCVIIMGDEERMMIKIFDSKDEALDHLETCLKEIGNWGDA